jgi:glycosyltransferase involved in cell wall biosynthesis
MKIAVYHNMISGGNKRSLYEKVRGFKKYGHTVEVFNLSISNETFASLTGVADKIHTSKVKDFKFGGPLKILNPFGQILQVIPVWWANKKIAQTINQGDYDIAWIGNCFVTQHPIILRYLSKPYVLYTAEHLRAYYEQVFWDHMKAVSKRGRILSILRWFILKLTFFIKAQIDKSCIRKAQNILVNSYFTKENLMKYYGVTARPLYLGIDLEVFKCQSLEKENYVLSIGGLSPLKGHDMVLEGVAEVPKSKRPKLVIIADRIDIQSEKERYEQFAISREVELDIRQNISDANMITLYNQAKITVCANLLEPFGLVPLESMGCGTPVVAVKEGGFRETIIHGETGLHVERNATALARAIEQALDHDEDLKVWAAKGLEHVQTRFSLEFHWANLEKQIQSVRATGKIDYCI